MGCQRSRGVLLGGGGVVTVVQLFKRFIEIGRVALVNYGKNTGSLCTIIDVLDQNRVRSALWWWWCW